MSMIVIAVPEQYKPIHHRRVPRPGHTVFPPVLCSEEEWPSLIRGLCVRECAACCLHLLAPVLGMLL